MLDAYTACVKAFMKSSHTVEVCSRGIVTSPHLLPGNLRTQRLQRPFPHYAHRCDEGDGHPIVQWADYMC